MCVCVYVYVDGQSESSFQQPEGGGGGVGGFTSAAASILRCHAARMSIHLSYHEDHNSL